MEWYSFGQAYMPNTEIIMHVDNCYWIYISRKVKFVGKIKMRSQDRSVLLDSWQQTFKGVV
jgi:hypothetical protein